MAASKKPRMKKKDNQLNTCCVAFGSNIISRYGNSLQTVCHAMKEIQTSQFKLTSMSSLYETVAYPKSSGPNFINGCALFKTDWDASEALSHLQMHPGLQRAQQIHRRFVAELRRPLQLTLL